MRITVTSPPAVEPIALGDAKLHLRVTIDDDDALITRLITAARQSVSTRLGQTLIQTSYTQYLDNFPWGGGYWNRLIRQQGPSPFWLPTNTGIVLVPWSPLISIDSINYYDYQGNLDTVDPSLYAWSVGVPGRLQPVYGKVWPIARPTIDSVQVNFTAGYGTSESSIPANIQAAMLLLIGNWYENRESQVIGTISGPLQDGIDALLAPSDPGEYW